MQKGLVSVLTPCYNGDKLISRLLDSLLQQDYPNMEIIIVDDGSTDNTKDVVHSYKQRFETKGISFNYIYQYNGGQSAAINNGLKYVNGEYLVWPDCDDYFRKHYSISKFVSILSEKGQDYGIVRCIPTYINEKTGVEHIYHQLNEETLKENQFENCLYSQNFFWGAGDYMVRMEAFDKTNPKREIYVEKNAGQNWQMLLPILYSYKCVTTEESLFNVLERDSSHCRGQYKTYEQKLAKCSSFRNAILQTIEGIATMNHSEKIEYCKKIIIKYKFQELNLAIIFNDKVGERRIISELSRNGVIVNNSYVFKLRIKNSLVGKFLKLFLNL